MYPSHLPGWCLMLGLVSLCLLEPICRYLGRGRTLVSWYLKVRWILSTSTPTVACHSASYHIRDGSHYLLSTKILLHLCTRCGFRIWMCLGYHGIDFAPVLLSVSHCSMICSRLSSTLKSVYLCWPPWQLRLRGGCQEHQFGIFLVTTFWS